MNLIPQIAKMLGMELNEEFRVITTANIEKRCRFHEAGNGVVYLEKYSEAYNQWTQENAEEIGRIVVGNYKVEKFPFVPRRGDTYYIVSVVANEVLSNIWKGATDDYCYKYCGNCFRTIEEAEAHKQEICDKLLGRE